MSARPNKWGRKGRLKRREEAEIRQAKRDGLSPLEQIDVLDDRGVVALKERKRLAALAS